MNQTLIGVIIGITTSFVGGIILIWKGEQIVRQFRYLPTKRRVALFTRAYLIAIRSYPYRYAHMVAMISISVLILVTFLSYLLMTTLALNIDTSQSPPVVKEYIRETFAAANIFLRNILYLNKLALPFLTLIFLFIGGSIILKTIPAELLVPYAHRELNRLRECVSKCSTKKQFLEYTDAEHNVRTLDDLRELIARAKAILGNVDLHLADEILDGLSENFPELDRENKGNES